MARNPSPTTATKTILDSLGEEIVRIVTPVSICMLMVVILVSLLTSDSSITRTTSIATVAYSETSSDSTWDKFLGALLNSLVFVVVVTLVTFALVLLFYLRCTAFLRLYMGFSAFMVLGFLGGEISVFLIQSFSVPIDCFTFFIVLFNFSVVGVLAVFMSKMAISVTQGYLVLIGILVAYWFTLLPEWTTWALLVAMSLYDLAAVLLPVGPLRILVELAMSRDEDIPALVYEARPVVGDGDSGPVRRRVWREQESRSSYATRNDLGDNRRRESREGYETLPLLDRAHEGANFGSLESGSSSVARDDLGENRRREVREGYGTLPLLDRAHKDANFSSIESGSSSVTRDDLGENRRRDSREGCESSSSPSLVVPSFDHALKGANFGPIESSSVTTRDDSGDNLVRIRESREEGREPLSGPSPNLIAPLFDNGLRRENSSTNDSTIRRRESREEGRESISGPNSDVVLEGMGLGSSGAIKLGLGDFIFYSVLVGRAAMYDMMTVYACYLAIVAGLGVTLLLLALYRKALPALPVSVMLGVLFYFLTRFLLETFVVQCSLNLLMF